MGGEGNIAYSYLLGSSIAGRVVRTTPAGAAELLVGGEGTLVISRSADEKVNCMSCLEGEVISRISGAREAAETSGASGEKTSMGLSAP